MPLRRWMTEHGHPGWYSWLVVVGGWLVCLVVSVGINKQMNERSIERERAQRAEDARQDEIQRALNRATSCAFIDKINFAYRAQYDELSPAGQQIADAWADLAKQC